MANSNCELIMTMNLKTFAHLPLFICLAFVGISVVAPVTAAASQAVMQLAQNDSGATSKARAAAIAQQKYGGKVLNVSEAGGVYRVKLLQQSGKVKIVKIPAASARSAGG
ncbi:PepSY domain-containing protein [Teredinibacter waterburyi]|jgi:hypothetical protein|uniref:PepSY domain-containing protein n=1 Tax=Teredinibacter waterburyi TaxID=1500538 RepID=UPI001FE28D92|nr:hypothetical protein [Teredinibacter waterburyi]